MRDVFSHLASSNALAPETKSDFTKVKRTVVAAFTWKALELLSKSRTLQMFHLYKKTSLLMKE